MQKAGHGPWPPWDQERPPATGFCCCNRRPRGGSRVKQQVSLLAPSQDTSPTVCRSLPSPWSLGPSTVPEGKSHAEGPKCPGGSGHGRPQPQVTECESV